MFRPAHQQPLHEGGQQQPSTSTQPVVVREAIDASQKWFDDQGQNATLAAQAIIARRASQIHQFYQAQRANRDISGLAISRTRLNLGDVQLAYEVNNGQPILSVVVFPENVRPGKNPLGGIDINLDGYFVWVHCEPNYPDLVGTIDHLTPNTPGPYDIYLNEYLVLENIAIDRACSAFLVMFGETALRVPSLVDPPDATVEENPLAETFNGGLVSGVAPLRKRVEQSNGPDGAALPAHNDLFGYWLFDWTNILNQGSYLQNLSVRWVPEGFQSPEVVQGIQFADPQSSPLVSDGVNNLSVTLSPLPNRIAEFEVIIQNVLYSEFYDRTEMKTAISSWRKSNLPSVIVNDKPLQFCASRGNPFLQNGVGIKVDLTPNLKPEDRTDDLVKVSDPPTFGQGPDAGISAAQVAANAAYRTSVQSISDAYYASIAAQITAAQSLLASLRTLYLNNVAALGTIDGSTDIQVPGGNLLMTRLNSGYVLTTTAEIDGVNVLNFALNDILILNTGRPPVDQFDLTALASATNDVASSGQPYLDASNALINLQTSPPPNLPPRPPAAGKKLSDFVYRLFTVSGDQWHFGAWQNR